MESKKKRKVHFRESEKEVFEEKEEKEETTTKSCIFEIWQKPVEMWMRPLKNWRNPMKEWERPLCTWLKSNNQASSTQEGNSGASIL